MTEDLYKHVNIKIQGVYDYWGEDTSFADSAAMLSPLRVENPSHRFLRLKINRHLFRKYSSSQNYYYTRDVNDFLADNRSA